MKDKTILDLTDRLVAFSNRAVLAEHELEAVKLELVKAQNKIFDLEGKLKSKDKEIETQKTAISYWADKAAERLAKLNEIKEANADAEI